MQIIPKKIKNKIIIYNSVLIISLITFLLIFINDISYETHLKIIEREMNNKFSFFDLCDNIEISNGSKSLKKISRAIGHRVTIINFEGRVIFDSQVTDVSKLDNHRYRQEVISSIEKGYGSSIRYSNTLKINMLYVAKKSKNHILRIAKPLFEIEKNISYIRKMITLSGFIVIFLWFIIITIISNKITGPIHETINFAVSFSNGDYSKRIMNYTDDEIGTLQRSLNKLADTIIEKINNLLIEQTKLKLIIDNIHDGIALIDMENKTQIVNTAFKSMLEIKMNTAQKYYYEVIRNSKLNSKIQKSIVNGKNEQFEIIFLNGIICKTYIIPINNDDILQGILLVLYDITERVKIDQIKSDLIGNMSHELKTPITILKGYIETINDNINNREMTEQFLNKALANVDRQNSLINDILKLNRIEQSPDITSEKINPREIINICTEILSPKTAQNNISITSNIDTANIIIIGSRFLAEEIFFNIIDNAINYNRKNGKIEIKSYIKNTQLVVEIADSGIGIPDESVKRIFERFFRVDKSRSRATGGTGLGLSIVKHAANLLNWIIIVKSDKNGTTFIIKINTN